MTKTASPDQEAELYAARIKRFNDVLDAYECGAGDYTVAVPRGMSRDQAQVIPYARLPVEGAVAEEIKLGRWAVITESLRGHGYFVENVADRAEIETTAAGSLHEGWMPVCYYDLDQLAGEEPDPDDGDRVRVVGLHGSYQSDLAEAAAQGNLFVVSTDYKDGRKTCNLAMEQDGDSVIWEYAEDLEVVERAQDDERIPVRFGLAKLVTLAAFNSIPSPA